MLVHGSASLAKIMGIPSLVIGLTVVAFGTSMPELTVNIFSALRGTADIAIGNIIGSNIFNILLILGISAAIVPLKVKNSTVRKEIPLALLAMVLLFLLTNDVFFNKASFNALDRTDGFAFIGFFIIFLYYVFELSRSGSEGKAEEVKTYSSSFSAVLTLSGLVFLFFGGKLLVEQAIILAKILGVSEALIGLTIVAAGTSLPELATSVVAAIHHYDDIAVGNIVGSNIFNAFFILGITSIILPLPFNPQANIDVIVGIAATFLLFIAMFIGTRHKLDRWQGILFVLFYLVYIIYLVQRG
jgi:cation:H+ antiporter